VKDNRTTWSSKRGDEGPVLERERIQNPSGKKSWGVDPLWDRGLNLWCLKECLPSGRLYEKEKEGGGVQGGRVIDGTKGTLNQK